MPFTGRRQPLLYSEAKDKGEPYSLLAIRHSPRLSNVWPPRVDVERLSFAPAEQDKPRGAR